MTPGSPDDFLPAATTPDQVARRRARLIKQWAIAGAVVGTAVAVVVVLIAILGGDDRSSVHSSTDGAHRRTGSTSTSTRRPGRTTTTTSLGDAGTTTSSTPTDGGTGSGGSAPPATASPGSTPAPTGSNGGITVTEDGGACTFDTASEQLLDTGMLQNSGTEEAVAEVQVTWSDDTGELDSWTDVQSVPPGGSTAWSVSTAWPPPVQGTLRCEITLI